MSAAALNMVSFCKGRNIDVVRLTVLCSSPSLTWNVCSKMVYMILPMPNEGSITLGTTSSTVDDRDIIKPLAPVSFPLMFLLSETHRAESSGIASRWPCPLWVWTLCLLSRWWTLWGAQIWKTNSFLKMYLKQPSIWWLATALTHSHWAAFPGL